MQIIYCTCINYNMMKSMVDRQVLFFNILRPLHYLSLSVFCLSAFPLSYLSQLYQIAFTAEMHEWSVYDCISPDFFWFWSLSSLFSVQRVETQVLYLTPFSWLAFSLQHKPSLSLLSHALFCLSHYPSFVSHLHSFTVFRQRQKTKDKIEMCADKKTVYVGY